VLLAESHIVEMQIAELRRTAFRQSPISAMWLSTICIFGGVTVGDMAIGNFYANDWIEQLTTNLSEWYNKLEIKLGIKLGTKLTMSATSFT